MVQTLSLRFHNNIPKEAEDEIFRTITPRYLKRRLKYLGIQNTKCPECGTSLYQFADNYKQIPTEDLTLRRTRWTYYGLASGPDQEQKLLVKGIALKGIKKILEAHRVSSEINTSDLDCKHLAIFKRYHLT